MTLFGMCVLIEYLVDMDDFNGMFCHNGTYPYLKQSLALLPDHMSSYV
jgi:hypothetical protein